MLHRILPIHMMLAAVVLWALYPPIVNLLLDRASPIALASLVQIVGAVSVFAIARLVFRVAPFRLLAQQVVQERSIGETRTAKFIGFALVAGILSVSNHLLLFYALARSERYDPTAILIFETWPVLFFVADTLVTLRQRQSNVAMRDWIYVAITFVGFALLMAQRIDLADWIILDQSLIDVALLALAGSLMMTLTVFCRRRANLMLKGQTDHPLHNDVHRAMTVEILGRIVSGCLAAAAAYGLEEIRLELTLIDAGILVFVSAVCMIGGAVLYHVALVRHRNASITAMWYLMPAGSLIFLAIIGQQLPNEYETVAAVLIVSANVLLSLNLYLRSSFVQLYTFLVCAGVIVVLVPGFGRPDVLDIVAISTIFYVLMITFALETLHTRNRAREALFLRLSQDLERVAAEHGAEARAGLAAQCDRVFGMFGRQRDAAAARQVLAAQHALEPQGGASGGFRDALATLRELATISTDRLGGGVIVVLSLLFMANAGTVLFLRQADFISDIFAFLLSGVEAYLFFLVIERAGPGFMSTLQNAALRRIEDRLASWRDTDPTAPGGQAKSSRRVIEVRTDAESMSPLTGFFVVAFLVSGFGYAIGYAYLTDGRARETNPLAAAASRANTVAIGYPDWPTAQVQAEIIRHVAGQRLGLEAVFVEMPSAQFFAAMDAGDGRGDVHPEVWAEPLREELRRYVHGFQTVAFVPGSLEGWQGFCVNTPGQEVLDGRGIEAFGDDAVQRAFDADDDGRIEMWLGAENWASQPLDRARLAAYGLTDKVDPVIFSEDLLDTALDYYARIQRPFLFSCYRPSALFLRGDAVQVPEPSFDPVDWTRVRRAAETGEPGPAVATAARPHTQIGIAHSVSLQARFPDLFRFLQNYDPTEADFVQWAETYRAGTTDPELIAAQWIATNDDRILDWVLP